jgi:diguanylate cyclase (GGDEF)-like protein
VGVLSLYSTKANSFNDDHCRIIEVVARQIAHTFARAIEFDSSSRRDSLTGLPHVEQLEKLVQSATENESALLFIDVADLKDVNVVHGRAAGDEVLMHVVRHARAGLRVADILFRHTGDDFIAFLSATDGDTAEVVAERIRNRISQHPVVLGSGASLIVEASVTAVSSPRDGVSLKDLLSVARQRGGSQPSPYGEPRIH